MIKHVLLVFSRQDREWEDLITEAMTDEAGAAGALPQQVDVESASTAHQALLKLSTRQFDLVLVGLALPPSAGANVQAYGGLDLCREIRKLSAAPVKVLVPEITNLIESACEDCGPDIRPYIVSSEVPQRARQWLQRAQPLEKRLNIIVYVRQAGEWAYELRGINPQYVRTGVLRIGSSWIKLISTVSDMLERAGERWYGSFQELGQAIMEEFCSRNEEFAYQLKVGLEQVGRLSNTRVCFVVESHYRIVFESLFLPTHVKPPLPWMVEAPLYRHVPGTSRAGPLFGSGTSPTRALIICADTDGQVRLDSKTVLTLGALQGLETESSAIERVLRAAAKNLPLHEVRVLGNSGSPHVTLSSLKEALSSSWDIIHFAGHAYFERGAHENHGRGYLFVGAPGKPEAIPIEAITPYLSNSKLLYLSSCQSGSDIFAIEAAKAGIPVIGFRWPVDDRLAALHARVFYRKLFRRRSVEVALWSTQRALHRHLQLHNAWASSMLVMAA